MSARHISALWLLVPPIGILLFVVLYVAAAAAYPGGSAVDQAHEGFDWIYNYWCDLISEYARNGSVNHARHTALAAMITLFASLALFWICFPGFLREGRSIRLTIGYTGVLAMLTLVFVYTKFHDEVILFGGVLSAVPFFGTLRELYLVRWRKLLVLGLVTLALILVNFYSYFSGWAITVLPLLQKIALVFLLLWIFSICWTCITRSSDVRLILGTPVSEKKKDQLPV